MKTNYYKIPLTLLVLSLLVVINPETANAIIYNITDLGTLAGAESSHAYGVNDNNQVVGRSDWRPVLWESSKITNIGAIGSSYGYANAINNVGQIVGFQSDGSNEHAFLWESGLTTYLDESGGNSSGAYEINESGHVAGFVSDHSGFHAVMWKDNTVKALGGSNSRSLGINDQDQVVGEFHTGAEYHAFLWENDIMNDLGTLGGTFSSANGINDFGQVVGYSKNSDSKTHAFLWENGDMIDLGALGGLFSAANSINNSGQIIGSIRLISGLVDLDHAFLWENGNMVDLNDLILPNAGWELYSANDINDMGQIVGYGSFNGETHAYLLEPNPVPEPTTIMLLGSGLVGLAGFRRKKFKK